MRPKFFELDGKRILWSELLSQRRAQIQAARQAAQPTLFELRDDRRPASQRTAAGRFQEPSLFTLIDKEG